MSLNKIPHSLKHAKTKQELSTTVHKQAVDMHDAYESVLKDTGSNTMHLRNIDLSYIENYPEDHHTRKIMETLLVNEINARIAKNKLADPYVQSIDEILTPLGVGVLIQDELCRSRGKRNLPIEQLLGSTSRA